MSSSDIDAAIKASEDVPGGVGMGIGMSKNLQKAIESAKDLKMYEKEMKKALKGFDIKQAWQSLKADPSAFLVDVRTQAEWNFVGIPDLSTIGKKPLFIEWQTYPSMSVNGSFFEEISTEISAKSAPASDAAYAKSLI